MCDINKKYRKKLKDKTEDRNAVIREIQENILKNYLSVNDWYKDSKIKNVFLFYLVLVKKNSKTISLVAGKLVRIWMRLLIV